MRAPKARAKFFREIIKITNKYYNVIPWFFFPDLKWNSLIFSKKVDFLWLSLIWKRDFENPWFSLIFPDAGHPECKS